MHRFVLGAALVLGACTQTDNNRPATLEYITEAILQPSCAQYDCHSSYRREGYHGSSYTFDTIDASKISLQPIVQPGDVEASFLIQVLTRNVRRMPYDAPLPDKDIDLIKLWIQDGAPGLQ